MGSKKQEFLGRIKLKPAILIGKRGGGTTTPSTTWRFGFFEPDDNSVLPQKFNFPTMNTAISARQMGANLWEAQPSQPYLKMSKGGTRRRHHRHNHENKSFELPNQLAEPSDSPPHQVVTGTDGAVTPPGSLGFRGRIRETNYGLKTSTELLKVLNRIWSLEEQHASNISLIKALKRELSGSQARIKELVQEKKRGHQENDELKKEIAEDIVRKKREQDQLKRSVQLTMDELESERQLRKKSESLQHKLARELSDVKSSFSNAVKELEREKKARILLEKLCDEFAKGIRDYEREVRLLKHKPEKGQVKMQHNLDRLILHVSEAWLDERIQMKIAEARSDFSEKNTIFDKLSFEIEKFLRAKQKQYVDSGNDGASPRHFLESFQLNEVRSAPTNGIYGEDSVNSGSCFEFNQCSRRIIKNGCSKHNEISTQNHHLEDKIRSDSTKKVFEGEENSAETKTSQKMEVSEIMQAGGHELCSNEAGDRLKSESSLKLPPGVRENSLKAKLLEARLESQLARSRREKGSV